MARNPQEQEQDPERPAHGQTQTARPNPSTKIIEVGATTPAPSTGTVDGTRTPSSAASSSWDPLAFHRHRCAFVGGRSLRNVNRPGGAGADPIAQAVEGPPAEFSANKLKPFDLIRWLRREAKLRQERSEAQSCQAQLSVAGSGSADAHADRSAATTACAAASGLAGPGGSEEEVFVDVYAGSSSDCGDDSSESSCSESTESESEPDDAGDAGGAGGAGAGALRRLGRDEGLSTRAAAGGGSGAAADADGDAERHGTFTTTPPTELSTPPPVAFGSRAATKKKSAKRSRPSTSSTTLPRDHAANNSSASASAATSAHKRPRTVRTIPLRALVALVPETELVAEGYGDGKRGRKGFKQVRLAVRPNSKRLPLGALLRAAGSEWAGIGDMDLGGEVDRYFEKSSVAEKRILGGSE